MESGSSESEAEERRLDSAVSQEDVAVILKTWGFKRLTKIFLDGGFDTEALSLLDEQTARTLLKPAEFVKFWRVLELRRRELADSSEPPEPPGKKRCVDVIGQSTSSSQSNNQSPSSQSKTPPSQSKPSTSRSKTPPSQSGPSTSRSKSVEDDSYYNLSDDEEAETAKEEPVSEAEINEIRGIFTHYQGQILLATSELSDSERDSIAQLVICHELFKNKPDGHIKRSRLIILSRIIAKNFQNESTEVYYVPYLKVNRTVHAAKGKLVGQYYSWRRKGIAAKVLTDSRTHAKPAASGSQVSADVAASVKWLKVNLGPQPTVETHWDKTFEYRMHLLDPSRNDKIDIAQYYSLFPVLRQPWGYALLLQDYKKLHDGTENNLSLNWDAFAVKLLEKLRKVKGLHVENLVDLLKDDHGVNVLHHFLMLFANVFLTQVVVRGRKPNNWTATKAEMQQGFLLHVKTEEELLVFIANKLKRLKAFKKTLKFQPFPVIIGTDFSSIARSLVVVEPEQFYLVDSPFEAIDVCFKLYQSLLVEYPPESKGMWRVLQQCANKVRTKYDVIMPTLVPLLKFFTLPE